MKKDAHYYALLAMARSLGIEKETAHKIAYASQFVDDARINKITLAADNPAYILAKFENNEIINAATCHSYTDLSTYNYSSMTANTSAFHFVPGCEGKNFPKKMRCKKDSKIIKAIIKKAINSSDPIKLGITLHAYADTFSHQGFSGIVSKVNDVEAVRENNKIPAKKCELLKERAETLLIRAFSFVSEKIRDQFVPAYGHGQVYSYPDIPYLEWRYEYDDQLWLKKAFKDFINCDFESRIVEDVHLASDFLQSNWYQYYQGIMWYKKLFFKIAAQNGLSIPNNYS